MTIAVINGESLSVATDWSSKSASNSGAMTNVLTTAVTLSFNTTVANQPVWFSANGHAAGNTGTVLFQTPTTAPVSEGGLTLDYFLGLNTPFGYSTFGIFATPGAYSLVVQVNSANNDGTYEAALIAVSPYTIT